MAKYSQQHSRMKSQLYIMEKIAGCVYVWLIVQDSCGVCLVLAVDLVGFSGAAVLPTPASSRHLLTL